MPNPAVYPNFSEWAKGAKERIIADLWRDLVAEANRKADNAEFIRKANENPPPKI